jgi:ribosomal protein S8E
MVTYAADRQPTETKISEQKMEKQATERAEERSLARTSGGGIYVNTS